MSINSAYYTPTSVIDTLWDAAEKLGGNILEPANGVGHIIGKTPKAISENSNISAFEIDSISGRINQQLYPDANIRVSGYETEYYPSSKGKLTQRIKNS